MTTLGDLRSLGSTSEGLVVVSALCTDGTVVSTVVNAGVLAHPDGKGEVVGFVIRGGTGKHRIFRKRPRATVAFRSGWRWAAAEGPVELAGPDDAHPGIDATAVPGLLRDIFVAAGGTHDDWDGYDEVMAAERRLAVLLRPERIYGLPG